MKTLALFSLSLAVTLGMPPFAPGAEPNPVLTKGEQSPLLGDWVPVQGRVVVEDPAPQVRPGSAEQKEVLAPVPEDMKQSMVEQEIKVKPQVREEGEVKTEIKKEPDVKAEPDVKEHLEAEVKLNPEVKAELNADVEPEINDDPEFKVKSEVESDVQEQFQVQMNLEPEPETVQEIKERQYEMVDEPIMELEPLDDDNMELSEVEKSLRAAFQNQNPVNHPLLEEGELLMSEKDNVLDEEPIMELEPMDDDKMSEEKLSRMELSDVEKSLMAKFQNKNPVNQPLSEEEGLMSEMDNVLDEEPIMELEPEEEQSFLHQQVMPEAAIMEEGPALDIMGQWRPSLSEYFPNEEAMMGMEHGQPQDYLTIKESGSELFREEKQTSMGLPEVEDGPDGEAQIGVEKQALIMRQGVKNPEETRSSPSQDKQGRSHCPGVIHDWKCYQFFKEPKTAADAEFFCQEHFAGGHLASITSQQIHREVMNMMLQQNGALTRSWIGGLQYLKTGRFIWLDGSHWSYSDWLSGEPNNTADVEHCVEVLPYGNGKFNDFTCWEDQAFICSYPYQ